jgi:hypothetical protein
LIIVLEIRSEGILRRLREENVIEEIKDYQSDWKQNVRKLPLTSFSNKLCFIKPTGKRDFRCP